jgi:predicted PurR-regulated permease PerM
VENQLPVAPERSVGLYSGRQVRDAALLLLTGIALYLCWLLARPFLAGITWALALAVVAYPLQYRFERWFRPNPAALLSLLMIVIVLLAPGTLLMQKALEEAGGSLGAIGRNFSSARIQETAERYPFFARVAGWLAGRFDVNQELARAAGTLASQASAVLGGSIRLVTEIVIMLVTLFYFLRDHKSLLQYLRRLVPLSQAETDQLFGRVSDTIYATLYGNLVVKLVQGVLGGAMFWVLDLPAPVLCGIAMALFAMLPVVGTSLVWGPAAIFLLIQGSWVKAIVLTVWGSLVVSLIDNFLYPILIASELRIHTLGVLLSILGGLIAFGIAGIVLGPVILASTVALLEIWRHRAQGDAEKGEPERSP